MVEKSMLPLYRFDGRWLVATAILVYMGILFIAPKVTHIPLTKVWRSFGVIAADSRFEDLHVVVVGIANAREGMDPWKPTKMGQVDWVYNYPRWWLYADRLGLNAKTLNGFGIGLGSIFLGTFIFILGRLTLEEGLWASLFVLSPCVMLAVERGNIDLVLFILLGVCVGIRRVIPLSILLMVFATVLKLFPVFGLLAFVAPPWRKTLPWLAAAVVICLSYFIFDLAELNRVAALTPHLPFRSYGASTLFMQIHQSPHVVFADLILVVVIVLSVWFSAKAPSSVEHLWWQRDLFTFRIGAGVFLGTFALLSNWDYRLIFLAFCLPLLFRLRRDGGNLRTSANIALGLILIYTNWDLFSSEIEKRHLLIKTALSWGIVCALSGIWASTFDYHSLIKKFYAKSATVDDVASLSPGSAGSSL